MTGEKHNRYILAAQVGSTNTTIAVIGARKREFEIIFSLPFMTSGIGEIHNNINDVITVAKERYNLRIRTACISAAGPVTRHRGYIKLTNTDLEVNRRDILENTSLSRVILLNDYEAIGYGIDLLDLRKDVIVIPHIGEDLTYGKTEKSPIAVIGASSGLGMSIAPYVPRKHQHVPIASEGGHTDMVAYDKLEYEFVQYLRKNVLDRDVQPETERVLSSKGMKLILQFLVRKKSFRSKISVDILKSDIGIVEKIEANYHLDVACKKTIDMFMSFYARTCRNLALVSECYSGLFLLDMIALRNIRRMNDREKLLRNFMIEFEKHDKRSDVLRKIPVYIISNKNVALYGCCNVALYFDP